MESFDEHFNFMDGLKEEESDDKRNCEKCCRQKENIQIDQGMLTCKKCLSVISNITDNPESLSFDASQVGYGSLISELDGQLQVVDSGDEVIILWFSFTGQYIPAESSGDLLTLGFDVDGNAPNGELVLDFADKQHPEPLKSKSCEQN